MSYLLQPCSPHWESLSGIQGAHHSCVHSTQRVSSDFVYWVGCRRFVFLAGHGESHFYNAAAKQLPVKGP